MDNQNNTANSQQLRPSQDMETYVAYLSCQAYEDTDFRILYAGDNYESALIAAETATSYLGTPYTYVQTWVDGSLIKEIEVQN